MDVDSEPRKLERHIEEEMGAEYILDLQSEYISLTVHTVPIRPIYTGRDVRGEANWDDKILL